MLIEIDCIAYKEKMSKKNRALQRNRWRVEKSRKQHTAERCRSLSRWENQVPKILGILSFLEEPFGQPPARIGASRPRAELFLRFDLAILHHQRNNRNCSPSGNTCRGRR